MGRRFVPSSTIARRMAAKDARVNREIRQRTAMTLQEQADAIIFKAMKSAVQPLPAPPSTDDSLRVVCAWCGRVMQGGPPDRISHGMCSDCEATMKSGDCVACDGYVLSPLEAPYCPTCARLTREQLTPVKEGA